jgi:hypothetical protein
LLSNNPDDQVQTIMDMKAVTNDELEEAIVIRNLVKLKGHLVSKDEAIKEIIKRRVTNS